MLLYKNVHNKSKNNNYTTLTQNEMKYKKKKTKIKMKFIDRLSDVVKVKLGHQQPAIFYFISSLSLWHIHISTHTLTLLPPLKHHKANKANLYSK